MGLVRVGQTPRLIVRARVRYDGPTVMHHAATVSSSTSDGVSGNNQATLDTTVTGQFTDAVLSMTGPPNANRGELLYLNVHLFIGAASVARNVMLSIPTPSGLTFNSADAPCAAGFPCSLGDLIPGQEVNFQARFNVPGGYAGADPIVATASVTTATLDTNPANDSAQVSTPVLTSPSADLALTATGPPTAAAGSKVIYRIRLRNLGPNDAGSVTLSATPAAGLTFFSGTYPCTTLPCTTSLNVGELLLDLVYDIAGSGVANPLSTSFDVATAHDPTTANNGASVTTPLGADAADLKVELAFPPTAFAGSEVLYLIRVTNRGPGTAANVVVSDPTPAGLTLEGIIGQPCIVFPCAIGSLANGQTKTVSAAYTLPITYVAPNPIVNAASATGDTPEAFPGDNSSTGQTSLLAASADVTVDVIAPPTVMAGTNAVYHLRVHNVGDTPAAGVMVNGAVPGLALTSVSPPCSVFPCSLGVIGRGATVDLQTIYSLPATFTNPSIVNDERHDHDAGDGLDEQLRHRHEPGHAWRRPRPLRHEQSAAGRGSRARHALQWVLTVRNDGPSSVTGVKVNVNLTLPPNVTLQSSSESLVTRSHATDSFAGGIWTVGNLAPGASATLTLNFVVEPFIGDPRVMAGSATLQSVPETQLNSFNDDASLSVPVLSALAADQVPMLDWLGLAVLLGALAAVAALRLR
jgi:uncharacterized repeat protein (TIGR01451 family)